MLEHSWTCAPMNPQRGLLCALLLSTKGEQPLQGMQCGISDGSDTQQHGHRDTKATLCACDQSAEGRYLHCSSETLVCVLLAPSDLCPDTRDNFWANSKLRLPLSKFFLHSSSLRARWSWFVVGDAHSK